MRYKVTVEILGVRYTTTVDTVEGPDALLKHIENFNDKPHVTSVEYHIG